MQGWRMEMEDRHSARLEIPEWGPNISWFAVYDGHSGAGSAKQCSTKLLKFLLANKEISELIKKEHDKNNHEFRQQIKNEFVKTFVKFDANLRSLPEVVSGGDKSGTTAVCSLITENFLMLFNLGDSRA